MANITINQTRHDSYMVNFFNHPISTLVTSDPVSVCDWISYIKSFNGPYVVGLDVEWRPPYSPIPNPVATLQLCVGDFCLIYQLIHSRGPIPYALIEFLSDWRYTFVGVKVQEDLDKLERDYGFGSGAKAVDLGMLAARQYGDSNMKSKGLKSLAQIVMGVEVEKPQWVTRSNWDNRCLTAEQVQYACVDAFMSHEIGRLLNAAN